MYIVNKPVATAMINRHPTSEPLFGNWYLKANDAEWKKEGDMRKDFDNVEKGEEPNEYVFPLGKKFVIVARVNFKQSTILIDYACTRKELADLRTL